MTNYELIGILKQIPNQVAETEYKKITMCKDCPLLKDCMWQKEVLNFVLLAQKPS